MIINWTVKSANFYVYHVIVTVPTTYRLLLLLAILFTSDIEGRFVDVSAASAVGRLSTNHIPKLDSERHSK